MGRVAIDPLLKQLITRADRDESAVPLTLFTACGRLSGHTTDRDDFYRTSRAQLEQLSEVNPVAALEGAHSDDDYLYLASAKSWTTPVQEHTVLRVALADVIAWTIERRE
jgi:hypothetical protein